MPFSDDDKSWLIENIGNIVAAATTAMARDLSLLKDDMSAVKQDVRELKQSVARLEEGQAELEEGQAELKQDVRDIRHFTALLSRDMMVTKDQTDERLTALETTVAALKAKSE